MLGSVDQPQSQSTGVSLHCSDWQHVWHVGLVSRREAPCPFLELAFSSGSPWVSSGPGLHLAVLACGPLEVRLWWEELGCQEREPFHEKNSAQICHHGKKCLLSRWISPASASPSLLSGGCMCHLCGFWSSWHLFWESAMQWLLMCISGLLAVLWFSYSRAGEKPAIWKWKVPDLVPSLTTSFRYLASSLLAVSCSVLVLSGWASLRERHPPSLTEFTPNLHFVFL